MIFFENVDFTSYCTSWIAPSRIAPEFRAWSFCDKKDIRVRFRGADIIVPRCEVLARRLFSHTWLDRDLPQSSAKRGGPESALHSSDRIRKSPVKLVGRT